MANTQSDWRVSRVEIQHLNIPAAMFTDAVDLECVRWCFGIELFADSLTGLNTFHQVGGHAFTRRALLISTGAPG